MKINTQNIDGILIVEIVDDHLDSTNFGDFKETVKRVIHGKTKVLFDLSHVNFIDSSGVGSILVFQRTIRSANGVLKISCITEQVSITLGLLRVHKIMEIFTTREEALRSFK